MPPSPIQLQVFNNPGRIWAGSGDHEESVLVLNMDTTANLYVGYVYGNQIPNSVFLGAGASAVFRADIPLTAFTDALPDASGPGNITILVAPGLLNYILGPAQIVQTLNIAALAGAIAAAIAATGVSLLAAPVMLYQIPAQAQPGTLVGATVSTANYGGGTSQHTADSNFDVAVGRPMATTAQKFFYSNEGNTPAAIPAGAQAILTDGAALLLMFKPCRTASGVYTDTTVCTNGNTCLQEVTALKTAITTYQTSGATIKVAVWNEPNVVNNFTPATFLAFCNYYVSGPHGIKSMTTPPKVVYVGALGNNSYTWVAMHPGQVNADEAVVDYYCNNYLQGYHINQPQPGDTLSPLAVMQAYTPTPGPIGVGEADAAADNKTQITTANWTAYINEIISILTGYLGAGNSLSWVLFWMGAHATQDAQNQVLSNTDFKVPGIQNLYDALSSVSTAVTVQPGANTILVPLNPSPNQGHAIANGLSYELSLTLIAGSGSTIPFGRARINWFPTDNANALDAAQEYWVCPMGAFGTTGTSIKGRGPMRAGFLQIRLENLDTVVCTVQLQVNSSGRQTARDEWEWDSVSSVSVPGYSPAGGAPSSKQLLGISGLSVPASGSIARLMSMWAGNVFCHFNDVGSSGKLTFSITPQPSSVWSTTGTSEILSRTPTGEDTPQMVKLPRGPCLLTVTNADAGAAHSFSATIVADDT